MKSVVFIIVALGIFLFSTTAQGQKRPVKKPAPTATPQSKPTKSVSPAEGFYNEGLKCDAKDFDCQVSNYTKAINLGLSTSAVYKNRGIAFSRRKDFDKAIADFTKLIELDPNDTSGFKNRGNLYLEISSSPQAVNAAIRDYTSAMDLDPKDLDLYLQRSRGYITIRNFDKASVDLEKADSIFPNNPNIQIIRGQMLLAQNEFERAIDAFSKAISLNAAYDTYMFRGDAYVSRKKYDLASADFSKAIQLEPTKAQGYIGRGGIAEKGKQFDEALTDYTKAIDLDKNSAKAFEARSRIYLEKKEYAKAIDDASKAITLQPNSHEAFLVRMQSRFNTNGGKVDDQYNSDLAQWRMIALRSANREIAENPRNIDALRLRVNVNRSNSQFQLAIDDLQKATEIEPNNAELRYEIAALYQALGNKFKAEIELDKAIQLDPTRPEYYELRANLYIASNPSFVDDRAIEALSKAIDLDPKNARYYFSRASMYSRRTYPKSRVEALQDFDKAAGLSADLRSYSELQQISVVSSLTSENDTEYSKIKEGFLDKKIESSPQNAHYYILRAKYLERFWDLRDPNSSVARAMNMKKFWTIARDNAFAEAMEDYKKCSELSIEKKQFCLDAAATFKSKVMR